MYTYIYGLEKGDYTAIAPIILGQCLPREIWRPWLCCDGGRHAACSFMTVNLSQRPGSAVHRNPDTLVATPWLGWVSNF